MFLEGFQHNAVRICCLLYLQQFVGRNLSFFTLSLELLEVNQWQSSSWGAAFSQAQNRVGHFSKMRYPQVSCLKLEQANRALKLWEIPYNFQFCILSKAFLQYYFSAFPSPEPGEARCSAGLMRGLPELCLGSAATVWSKLVWCFRYSCSSP